MNGNEWIGTERKGKERNGKEFPPKRTGLNSSSDADYLFLNLHCFIHEVLLFKFYGYSAVYFFVISLSMKISVYLSFLKKKIDWR